MIKAFLICMALLYIVLPEVSAAKRLTNNGNGTVTDSKTLLMWQQGEGDEMKWKAAMANCKKLSLAGYNDWRLPNKEELESLIDEGKSPAIDKTYFPNVDPSEYSSRYWSSTTDVNWDFQAWYVHFYNGRSFKRSIGHRSFTLDKESDIYQNHVRCVRGGKYVVLPEGSAAKRFTNNSNGTVWDSRTHLTWQRGESHEMKWKAAMANCKKLSLAGYDDWRLPNIKELESLIDVSVMKTIFPNAHTSEDASYWSSTPDPEYTLYIQGVNFYYGNTGYGDKTTSNYVRCVRGEL